MTDSKAACRGWPVDTLYGAARQLLDDPDVHNLGFDTGGVGSGRTFCFGWEFVKGALSPDEALSVLDPSGERKPSPASWEEIEQRFGVRYLGIVHTLLSAVATKTGKVVCATSYSLSGWSAYYDTATTYVYRPYAPTYESIVSR